MRKLKLAVKKIKIPSILKQLLVVWLAFLITVVISYWFTSDIVNGYLAKEAENTLSYMQSKILTDLREGETTLQGASQSIHGMILRGNSADAIFEYMTEISEYLSSENVRISGFYGVFDVFRNMYLDGIRWIPPEDYAPAERPWYKAAVAGNGVEATTHHSYSVV